MGKYPLKHRSIQKAKGFIACTLIFCMLILCAIPASAAESSDNRTQGNYEETLFVSGSTEGESADQSKTVDTQNRAEETEEPGEDELSEGAMDPLGSDRPSDPEEPSESGKEISSARLESKLEDILETKKHIAYIDGYSNNMFKPGKVITRAETANIFYKLLIDSNYASKTFSDVSSSKWYHKQVGIMATLGVVGGYTDGTFKPDKGITRAEFVKMAVCFMGVNEEATANFSDVTTNHWAYQYIATAAQLGWIDGYSDGTFRPGEEITRAQAVTVINRMLGRYPPADIKNKKDVINFYDLYPSYWAYGQVLEAANEHEYEKDAEKKTETWTNYLKDTTVQISRWINDGNDSYYVDASTGKFVRGKFTINGKEYIFDSTTGKAFTGFMYVGQWKRYFQKGLMVNNISGLGVVSGPYYIKVYKQSNYLIIYAKDGDNGYTIPVKAMITSCGYGTPTGTYYTPARYRWLKMVGDTWAQWCTQIQGNYLFHSVPNWTYNNFDLEVHEYNRLGETRSLGCIRLTCADAKWIYDNCVIGSKVFISSIETSGPLSKPGSLKLPSWHTWDPTDPTAYWKCQQNGCH